MEPPLWVAGSARPHGGMFSVLAGWVLPPSVSPPTSKGSDCWGLDQSPETSRALEVGVDLGFPHGGVP